MEKELKTTKKGYIRTRRKGKLRLEHNRVWEEHFGEIPDGYQIHHRDGNKTNNNIENLQLVTPFEHKRIHEGCQLIEDVWCKPCSICGEYKPRTPEYWYYSRGYISGTICKRCYIQKSLALRKILIAKGWKRKNYPRKTQVYNLTIAGTPAFDTAIGVSHNCQKPVKLLERLIE